MAKRVKVTLEFLLNDNPEFGLASLSNDDLIMEICDWAEDEHHGIAQYATAGVSNITVSEVCAWSGAVLESK